MSKKKKEKKEAPLKPGFVKCSACGRMYKEGAPHAMFCEANTCEECGTSYPGGVEKDENGRRVCTSCQGLEEMDEEED